MNFFQFWFLKEDDVLLANKYKYVLLQNSDIVYI